MVKKKEGNAAIKKAPKSKKKGQVYDLTREITGLDSEHLHFDAKRKESGLSNKNNQDYRAVGATFFLNYPCNEFDLDKLLQDKDFGEMVIKKDTSKVFYATNYKK